MKPSARSNFLHNKHLAAACRVAVGLLFLFSGATKIIDPYGTALKIGEYLTAFGLGAADFMSSTASIVLVVIETALGITLVFNAFPRLSSLAAMLFMCVYTPLTLWLAIANPIADCGCFGDVVILSNWQTFYKNLIILLFVVPAWLFYRNRPLFEFSRRNVTIAVLAVAATLGFALRNLWFLPVIDTTPFKTGTNLREAAARQPAHTAVKMRFRNKVSGLEREFYSDDPAWWDESVWEYVETVTPSGNAERVKVTARDFAIYGSEGDATDMILSSKGEWVLLCAQDLGSLGPKEMKALAKEASEALGRGARVAVITSSPLGGADSTTLNGLTLPLYNMDITALQVLLRAKAGAVAINDGTIVSKQSIAGLVY